jgi:hypothetical protein
MIDMADRGQRTQPQSRAARKLIPLSERLGYSPAEFGGLFGRSPTWGYRQIYAGRVKPISDCGRILVPRSEVDSFLARSGEYNPKPTRKPIPEPQPEEAGQPS